MKDIILANEKLQKTGEMLEVLPSVITMRANYHKYPSAILFSSFTALNLKDS